MKDDFVSIIIAQYNDGSKIIGMGGDGDTQIIHAQLLNVKVTDK